MRVRSMRMSVSALTKTETIGKIVIPRADESISGANFEVLVGFDLTEDQLKFNQNGRRFMAYCKYLKGQIAQQKLRLDKVSGKQLQYATQNELDELLAIQKSAQEATERAISYYRSRDRS